MPRRLFWFSAVLCLMATTCELAPSAQAQPQSPRTIHLWPDGVPEPKVPADPPEMQQTGKDGLTRRFFVSQPRLFVHHPENQSTAAAAIIVVPGGGFGRLADEHEGSDVCRWLNARGIVGIQLAYRTPTNGHSVPVEGPAQDLQKAILTVREMATELKVDPARIGVMGFSAGGQTALVATAGKVKIALEGDQAACRPNVLLLIYPYQVLNSEQTAVRSDVNLDGPWPPTFIAQAADDNASPPQGSAILYSEIVRRKIPAELHIYQTGGHGFGMRPRPDAPGSKDWSIRAEDWLRIHHYVGP